MEGRRIELLPAVLQTAMLAPSIHQPSFKGHRAELESASFRPQPKIIPIYYLHQLIVPDGFEPSSMDIFTTASKSTMIAHYTTGL